MYLLLYSGTLAKATDIMLYRFPITLSSILVPVALVVVGVCLDADAP